MNKGESWNLISQIFNDVSDLTIEASIPIKVECCCILPTQKEVALTIEGVNDCVAYIAIQFLDELEEVELLGFIKNSDINQENPILSIEKLDPIDSICNYLKEQVLKISESVSFKENEILIGHEKTLEIKSNNSSSLNLKTKEEVTKFAKQLLNKCKREGISWVNLDEILEIIDKVKNKIFQERESIEIAFTALLNANTLSVGIGMSMGGNEASMKSIEEEKAESNDEELIDLVKSLTNELMNFIEY